MTPISEVVKRLTKIRAKIILRLPLTTYEIALWTLYGHLLEGAL